MNSSLRSEQSVCPPCHAYRLMTVAGGWSNN